MIQESKINFRGENLNAKREIVIAETFHTYWKVLWITKNIFVKNPQIIYPKNDSEVLKNLDKCRKLLRINWTAFWIDRNIL
jgi:hypothetical protein